MSGPSIGGPFPLPVRPIAVWLLKTKSLHRLFLREPRGLCHDDIHCLDAGACGVDSFL